MLDRVAARIRGTYYSRRTGEAYAHWIRRFILFHDCRHPREMGKAEVTAFLNHLATERNVAPGMQNQALSETRFRNYSACSSTGSTGWCVPCARRACRRYSRGPRSSGRSRINPRPGTGERWVGCGKRAIHPDCCDPAIAVSRKRPLLPASPTPPSAPAPGPRRRAASRSRALSRVRS